MPTESIVFDPEIDERELDKTVDDTNDAFHEAATDLPVTVDDGSIDDFEDDLQNAADDVVAEIEAEMDAMTPGGGAGGVLAGGALGAGAAGAAAGAPALPGAAAAGGGAAAMASRIPKPIAGVAAASAMPVALAGGVGAGMLSAMTSASARLQTSNSMLQTAWDNIWRAPGDLLDKHIARPIAQGLLEDAVNFDELFRKGKFGQAIEALATGRDPRRTALDTRLGGIMGSIGGGLLGGAGGYLAGGAVGGAVAGATGGSFLGPLGALGGAGIGAILGTGIGGRLSSALVDKVKGINAPEFPGWPSIPKFPALPDFPGWPELPDLPDWSDLAPDLPTWDSLKPNVPSWNSLKPNVPRWSHLKPSLPNWQGLTPGLPDWPSSDDILGEFPSINTDSLVDTIFPSATGDTQGTTTFTTPGGETITVPNRNVGTEAQDYDFNDNARGGILRRPTGLGGGQRAGEAGPEVLAPYAEFRRTVEEAVRAGATSGGNAGGDGVDMSRVEDKLDRLHRDLQRLTQVFDVSVEVDGEEIARASKDGEKNRIGDMNPSV